MKKLSKVIWSLMIIAFFASNQVVAKNFNHLKDLHFQTDEDYQKHQKVILEAAEYLISTPLNKRTKEDQIAVQAIIKWIANSEFQSLALNEMAQGIMNENEQLIDVYMACIVKCAIENKGKESTIDEIKKLQINSIRDFVSYCTQVQATTNKDRQHTNPSA